MHFKLLSSSDRRANKALRPATKKCQYLQTDRWTVIPRAGLHLIVGFTTTFPQALFFSFNPIKSLNESRGSWNNYIQTIFLFYVKLMKKNVFIPILSPSDDKLRLFSLGESKHVKLICEI